jgi:alpha-mannosidase
MENHPHDSICGCSVDQVHDEMEPRFDQADQIGEEITSQALRTLSRAIDTRAEGAESAIVLFNPSGSPRQDLIEIDLSLPRGIDAFELVDAENRVIPHESTRGSDVEYANIMLRKENLRDSIGYVHEGRVLGAAITSVKVSREDEVAKIVAVLDDAGQPNIAEWKQAEEDIAILEADPGVTHFHVIARTAQASSVRFVSPAIPAMGWRTLWVRAVEAPERAPAAEVNPFLRPLLPLALRFAQSSLGGRLIARLQAGDETKPPYVIENERFRVEASVDDGTLTILDMASDETFRGLNRFMDGGDAGDEYNYSPPALDSLNTADVISIKVFRQGLIPSLEIEYALMTPARISPDRQGRSQEQVRIPIVSRISLVPGTGRIDVETEVDNRASDHRLRVHFPAPFEVQEADYDGHFEVVRRPVGVPERGEDWVEDPRPEVPQRAFTDISDGSLGLMIANRGLPEIEVLTGECGSEIALTLLRCVGWLSRDDMPVREGHAGPGFETPGGQVPGKWEFEYAIIPHRGGWRDAYQHGYAYQTALRGVQTGVSEGGIPDQGSFITHSPPEFIISAVKEAEDRGGWIVRGYNISSDKIQLDLKPLRRFASATRVNLAEDEIAPLRVEKDGNVGISVGGHEIVSVLFSDIAGAAQGVKV